MFRVGVGGIVHETNTYATDSFGPTGLDAFAVLAGQGIFDAYTGTRTCIGGMIDAAADLGAELVPLWWASAQPSGTIEAGAYETMRGELVRAVEAALPIDALALDLHGAGVADGALDLEADLGRTIRRLVGPDLPIVVTLDLHGNISDAMAELYDVMLGYHLYPHTDQWERGDEAMRLVPRLLAGELRPASHVEHLPILLPTSTTDPGYPAADMNDVCYRLEQRPGVVDCTVFHGFPFTDVPEVGVHVVVTTEADRDLARQVAAEVGSWIWQARERFRAENPTPEQAVRLAMEAPAGPVVINETSDNPGGGGPGDGTHLLRALMEHNAQGAVFGFLCDAEAAAACHAAGVGTTINLALGGKHDDLHGTTIHTPAYVKCLTDGRFTLTAISAGTRVSLGRCARIALGDRHGIEVIVTERRFQTYDESIFRLHGIDVRDYKIVALKSSNHFRAGFRDIAADIVTADAPGLTTTRVEIFDHTRAAVPLWPQDPAATYQPSA
ncbi:MAG: M81 family metallopeptidase [Acidimicrobiaceae bacterium]|nr:M81 family metallopeptidase [Acidimicrobiaceae bacterium]